jgi:hypothetical protein
MSLHGRVAWQRFAEIVDMKIYDIGCVHRQTGGLAMNTPMIGIRIAIVYRIGFERGSRLVNRTASYNIAVDKYRMSQ